MWCGYVTGNADGSHGQGIAVAPQRLGDAPHRLADGNPLSAHRPQVGASGYAISTERVCVLLSLSVPYREGHITARAVMDLPRGG